MFADRFNEIGQPGRERRADFSTKHAGDWNGCCGCIPRRQLYHQVADDRDHSGWRLPQDETVDYGWGKAATAWCISRRQAQGLGSSGASRPASRISPDATPPRWRWVTRFGKTIRAKSVRANAASRAARKSTHSAGQEGVQQGNSYGAPYRYAETTWADDMEWGAAELYRATGDAAIFAIGRSGTPIARTPLNHGWDSDSRVHYQFYPFMNVGHFRLYDLVDARTKFETRRLTIANGSRLHQARGRNPYRIGVPFIWCSNNLVVALATQALLYERMTGDKRYRQFTSKQVDWLMGRNPWGTSMITGVPADGVYPKDVHLFANALMKTMIRGGLIDGPVYQKVFKSLRGVFIKEPDPFAPFQDERAVYHDDINDYSTNEPTMDGTASAILLYALLGA